MTEFVTVPKAGLIDSCLGLYEKWHKTPEDKRMPNYTCVTIKATCEDVYAIADAVFAKSPLTALERELLEALRNMMVDYSTYRGTGSNHLIICREARELIQKAEAIEFPTNKHKMHFEKILGLWDIYQGDMRPETRNDFLRSFKEYRDGF